MTTSSSLLGISSGRMEHRTPNMLHIFKHATRPIRTVAKATVFFLKVFPMLPSRPIDWATKAPVVQKVSYPSRSGQVEGEIYRPPTEGPHPGILVCLGVVPFGVDHPQVPVLGKALARAGFAALLYWSPAMRDFRLDPEDLENIPLAYKWLIDQPYVDPTRSGLLGTCVGGSFSLMAAASPLIRDNVAFLSAYAPFSSMNTFARDIASASRSSGDGREPWEVDQLTRKVFVHSLTGLLKSDEAERIRRGSTEGSGHFTENSLSADGRAVYSLLTAKDVDDAEAALQGLPHMMQERLSAMSPINYLKDIQAPLIILLHDRGDQVIPVGESQRLVAALAGHSGVRYTEMQFSHLDPVKGKLPFFRLLRELGKFFRAVYPLFRQAVAP
jgi:dipeptidyl aminopeptidase/acylaminoacyl peptidase